MKKFLVFLALVVPLVLALSYGFSSLKDTIRRDFSQVVRSSVQGTPTPTSVTELRGAERSSVFVPYWAVSNQPFETEAHDRLIYFGIAPTTSGIDTEEAGYLALERFVQANDGKKQLLTLRMLDSTVNLAALKNKRLQQTIAEETVSVASEYGFDGIVLDLELSALPFESTIKQINDFTSLISKEVKDADLSFAIALYGDTFYRVRPFEVKTLAKHADEVMIMAYDFHKARGNPGPNFPLEGREGYGYDFRQMIDDYLEFVPPEKVTVTFGMFGYDWTVDGKQKAVGTGQAKSYLKMQQDFLSSCVYRNCKSSRDSKSGETKVTYTDDENRNHIVWFEDEASVRKKQEFLRSRGIRSVSYWAYSYF